MLSHRRPGSPSLSNEPLRAGTVIAASSDATAHFNRTHSRSQSHTGFPVDCLQSIACRCHLHRPGPLQPSQNLLSQPSGTSVPRCPLCLRAAASVSTSHPCGRHRHDRITERPPQGGTPGWQATRASPPCSRSQHHRDGPHDESGSPVTAFLLVLNRPRQSGSGSLSAVPPADHEPLLDCLAQHRPDSRLAPFVRLYSPHSLGHANLNHLDDSSRHREPPRPRVTVPSSSVTST